MRPKSVTAVAIAAALGLLGTAAAPARAGEAQVEAVVTGTAHQALFAVAFDGERGTAVGAGGQILLSDDGGKSWHASKDSGTTTLSLLGVDVVGGTEIAVGQAGLVLLGDEAGNWRKVNGGTQERLFAVSMNASGTAVAVGAFGTIVRSSDRGQTWQSIAPADIAQYSGQGAQPHLYAVTVDDRGTINVAGEFGLVLRSGDGGAHWAATHKGEASLFALDLHPGGLGYAVGQSGTILRTTDGGSTWSESNSNSNANLLSVSADPSGKVIVTAMHDVLVSDNGASWRQAVWGDFGSAWYSGVRFAGSESAPVAVLVGHSGRILRLEL
jgi:photosystem II stability/assembly factor-like uncharacterized protein